MQRFLDPVPGRRLNKQAQLACLGVPQLAENIAQGVGVALQGAVPQVRRDAQPLLLQASVPDPVLLPYTQNLEFKRVYFTVLLPCTQPLMMHQQVQRGWVHLNWLALTADTHTAAVQQQLVGTRLECLEIFS